MNSLELNELDWKDAEEILRCVARQAEKRKPALILSMEFDKETFELATLPGNWINRGSWETSSKLLNKKLEVDFVPSEFTFSVSGETLGDGYWGIGIVDPANNRGIHVLIDGVDLNCLTSLSGAAKDIKLKPLPDAGVDQSFSKHEINIQFREGKYTVFVDGEKHFEPFELNNDLTKPHFVFHAVPELEKGTIAFDYFRISDHNNQTQSIDWAMQALAAYHLVQTKDTVLFAAKAESSTNSQTSAIGTGILALQHFRDRQASAAVKNLQSFERKVKSLERRSNLAIAEEERILKTVKDEINSTYLKSEWWQNQRFQFAEEEIASLEQSNGKESRQVVYAKQSLGYQYWKTGRYNKAVSAFGQIIDPLARLHGENSEQTIRALINLSVNYRENDQAVESLVTAKRALELNEGRDKDADDNGDWARREIERSYFDLGRETNLASNEKLLLATLRSCLKHHEQEKKDSWETANLRCALGQRLLSETPDGIELLVNGVEALLLKKSKLPSDVKADVLKPSLKNLVKFYSENEDKKKLAKWEKVLSEFDSDLSFEK